MSRSWLYLAGSVLLGLLLWGIWPTLAEMADTWATSPQYSHGYLVPVFSLFWLWHRRAMVSDQVLQPSWWGVPLVLLGAVLHLGGGYFYFEWFSGLALLPLLAGIGLVLGGAKVLRWCWPAIAFLFFMMPLPFRVEHALAFPLQQLATKASTYVLQTGGFPAIAEGNIIIMEESRIGVVDACNGLGMLVTFFALTTGVTMFLRRHWLEKAFLVLSAIPIALFANVIRITATGILAETKGSEIADQIFHGPGGLLMTPLALGIFWIELKLIATLVIEVPAQSPLTLNLAGMELAKTKSEPEIASLSVG